jgi:hypothetical protein
VRSFGDEAHKPISGPLVSMTGGISSILGALSHSQLTPTARKRGTNKPKKKWKERKGGKAIEKKSKKKKKMKKK